jgi:hypothetical protein
MCVRRHKLEIGLKDPADKEPTQDSRKRWRSIGFYKGYSIRANRKPLRLGLSENTREPIHNATK